jgi:hypothetical protein
MKRTSIIVACAFTFLCGACGARSTLSDDLDVVASGSDAGVGGDARTDGSNPNCHDEIIASDPNGAIALAVDGDTVFWSNGDGLLQRRDTNGSQILANEAALTISSIAFDDSRVYYTIDNEVRAVSRAGGTPTTLATGVGYAFGLVIDGSTLYLLDRGTGILDGRVLRVDADGSVHELINDLDIPTGMAMDADSLYVASVAAFPPDGGNNEGPLFRIPKNGGDPVILGGNLYGPSSVGVDATNVYVAGQVENNPSGPLGSLLRIPKSGGAFSSVITTGEALDLDVTLDDSIAYMTSYAVPGDVTTAAATLLSIPLSGAPSTTLATTHHVVYGYVRTSPTAIYWTINWSATMAPDDGASVRKKCK